MTESDNSTQLFARVARNVLIPLYATSAVILVALTIYGVGWSQDVAVGSVGALLVSIAILLFSKEGEQ